MTYLSSETLAHFVKLSKLHPDQDERAYYLRTARRWAGWIIAGEA